MPRRRTRVQRLADVVLGAFYRLRIMNSYDDVERVASGLAEALHKTEAALVRMRDRA